MWFLSRLLIIVAMQLIAPSLNTSPPEYARDILGFIPNFVPQISWELFSHWDGAWYRTIATSGYEYINDGQYHNVAFFPLFPLISRGLMTLGLPFEVAAPLVNNFALLGAMLLLYSWAEKRCNINVARWSIAVLAWFPLSLFGTAIYTEGLFLLLTTAALRAFDKHQHIQAAFWGALATATRSTGITLIPAFFLVAWKEKRPPIAYAAGIIASVGLILFSLYCAMNFGDPLAFVHVQKAWGQPNWLQIFADALSGKKQDWMRIVAFFGSAYLLWHFRTKLPRVAVAYGFCSLALIQSTGALNSIGRYVFGLVSLSLALGILLSIHPRWGYGIISFFAIMLTYFSIRFTWWHWVA